MTPFVSGNPRLSIISPLEAAEQAGEYTLAYRLHFTSGDPDADAPPKVLAARYLVAATRTTWESRINDSKPDGDVTVTVTYHAQLRIPGLSRFGFFREHGAPYEYRISSSATLPNEAPASADRTLGIEYQSR